MAASHCIDCFGIVLLKIPRKKTYMLDLCFDADKGSRLPEWGSNRVLKFGAPSWDLQVHNHDTLTWTLRLHLNPKP